MVSFEWYHFKDTTYGLTHLPQNTQLINETTLYLYYVSVDDNKELWKYVKATGLDSLIETRDHKIQSLWNDGTYIWGVDCDNDGTADDFDVWKIAIADDTVTDIGTSAGADANTVYVYDIFIIGANTYVSNIEDDGGTKLKIWDVDTAPLTEKKTFDMEAGATNTTLSFGIVIGTLYYAALDALTLDLITLWKYDSIANSLTGLAFEATTSLSSDKGQLGLAYDGSNLIYGIITKDGDGKEYLYDYSITGDLITIYEESNVALMLDRNTLGTANSPWQYEKGFHLTSSFIYQIAGDNLANQYNLLKLQDLGLTGGATIKAITDKFCIDSDKNVYLLKESIADFSIAVGTCRNWDTPIGYFAQKEQLSPDQLFEIFENDGGTYQLVFRSKLGRPEYIHENRRFQYIPHNLGWDDLDEEISYNASAEGIDEVVIALVGRLTDPYVWVDATSVPNIAINMTYNFNRVKLREALYVCAILGNGYWWVEPNGYLYFRVYTDPPASGDAFSYANKNMTTPNLNILQVSYNDFSNIRGGMDLANGRPFEPTPGTETIAEHIQQYGKQLWRGRKVFSGARTQASLDAIVTGLKVWTGMVTNPINVIFNAKDKYYYPTGTGNTLTFEYNEALNFVPAEDMITIESIMDFLHPSTPRIIVSNNITRLFA